MWRFHCATNRVGVIESVAWCIGEHEDRDSTTVNSTSFKSQHHTKTQNSARICLIQLHFFYCQILVLSNNYTKICMNQVHLYEIVMLGSTWEFELRGIKGDRFL